MDASIVRRRVKKSELQALKQKKMKEIEKKIVYMVIFPLFSSQINYSFYKKL